MYPSYFGFHGWCVLLACLSISLPTIASAETKIVTAEGTYTMGDGETPLVAELRALQQAKRMAMEQAGTYVQSYTKTKQYELTNDDIEAISAGSMEVEVLEKKRTVLAEGIQFFVRIKATVTSEKTDELVARLKQKSLSESPDVVPQSRKLQDDYARLATDMEMLKQQMAEAKSEQEKQQAALLIRKQEQQYQARALYEECTSSYQENPAQIACMDRVIRLDPSFSDAWAVRAINKENHNDREDSIADYTEAIRLDPRVDWYIMRGEALYESKKPNRAIKDFHEAIRLDPKEAKAYTWRALLYYEKGKFPEAVRDYSKAIQLHFDYYELNHFDGKLLLPRLYSRRGLNYLKLREYQKAIADFTEAVQLLDGLYDNFYKEYYANAPDLKSIDALSFKSNKAQNLRYRGDAYGFLKRSDEAMRDYRQACASRDPPIPYFMGNKASKEACDLLKSH